MNSIHASDASFLQQFQSGQGEEEEWKSKSRLYHSLTFIFFSSHCVSVTFYIIFPFYSTCPFTLWSKCNLPIEWNDRQDVHDDTLSITSLQANQLDFIQLLKWLNFLALNGFIWINLQFLSVHTCITDACACFTSWSIDSVKIVSFFSSSNNSLFSTRWQSSSTSTRTI